MQIFGINSRCPHDLSRIGIGDKPAGGAGAPPERVDADRIRDDVEMLGEAVAFVLQARDEERVNGIRAANDVGFFLGENARE